MQRVEITVHGRVHGVCFRYFIKEEAIKLGLKGYVRNIQGDNVEIVSEGEEQAIKELIKLARKGPPLATVLEIDINYYNPIGEFKGFTINY